VNKDDFFELGYISRLHGVKGAFIVQLDTTHPERYRQLKEVWLLQNGLPVCFPVDDISVRNHEAIIRLQSVHTPDEASVFLRQTVFLPLAMLPPLSGKQFYFHEIKGFRLSDFTYGEVGTIETVYDLPQHPVAGIMVNGIEFLIPLAPDFIETIDRSRQMICTRLPDGMLEVYTQKTNREDEQA
jgi:16S rRNA processing protein RimM